MVCRPLAVPRDARSHTTARTGLPLWFARDMVHLDVAGEVLGQLRGGVSGPQQLHSVLKARRPGPVRIVPALQPCENSKRVLHKYKYPRTPCPKRLENFFQHRRVRRSMQGWFHLNICDDGRRLSRILGTYCVLLRSADWTRIAYFPQQILALALCHALFSSPKFCIFSALKL